MFDSGVMWVGPAVALAETASVTPVSAWLFAIAGAMLVLMAGRSW
jgi:hypothetical protein